MTRSIAVLLIAAMAAATAVGCGGDDDSLDKAEFVEQAQAACVEEKGDLLTKFNTYAEANERAGESPEELRVRLFKQVHLPILEAELEAVRELGVPSEGAAGLEEFLAAEQEAIDAAADVTSPRSEAAMRRRFDEAAELAERYGIAECANPATGLVGR